MNHFLFFILMLVLRPVQSLPSTTCMIKSVEAGQSTSLICNFGVDMQEVKKTIIVYHTKVNTTEKENFLNCFWSASANDYSCESREGTSLDGRVTERLILQIENIAEDKEGTYICQHTQSDASDDKECTFKLTKEVPPTTPTDSGATGTADTSVGADKHSSTTKRNILIGLLVPTFVVIILVVILVKRLKPRIKKRISSCVKSSTEKDDEQTPEQDAMKPGTHEKSPENAI